MSEAVSWLHDLPSDRLLTETDAPFTKVGDRPSAPIDVRATVEALSTLRGLTPEDLAQNIRSNLRTLLASAGSPPILKLVGYRHQSSPWHAHQLSAADDLQGG